MIVLDNMTLQGAARALSRQEADVGGSRSGHYRGNGKWDYAYSDDLRLTADVLALAQLVQAIVLYDKIGVGPYGTPSWARTVDSGGRQLETPAELDGLDGLLTVLDRGHDHPWLVIGAAQRAHERVGTDDFRDYVQTLEEHDAVGAYLKISNGYFNTGFSDEILCGDSADRDIFDLLFGPGPARPASPLKLSVLARLWNLVAPGKASPHRAMLDIEAGESRLVLGGDYRLSPFNLSKIDPGDTHEKVTAGRDLLRNIAAAYYYDGLAAEVGAAYAPHPLRTRFVEYSPADGLAPAEVVRRMEERRVGQVLAARESIRRTFRGGEGVPEVRLPFFLAAVLAESAEPEHVIAHALDLRDSRPATRLREWFVETHEMARAGDLGVDGLTGRVGELEKALDAWWNPSRPTYYQKITIGLSLGFATLQAQDVILPRLRFGKRRRRSFRLLYDMARLSRENLGLAPELDRVLGKDAGQAWRRCAVVFDQIENRFGRLIPSE